MADVTPMEGTSTTLELCLDCGQHHLTTENHIYNFQDEVDDELVCHICLQPLLQPMDTPCGHTYCYSCLKNFLHEKDFCPMDRKKLCFQECHKSSLLVRNLLDKLSVICPFLAECKQVMQRCQLEPHLRNRCAGSRKYRTDKGGNSSPGSVSKSPCENESGQASGLSSVLAESSLAAVVALGTSEPGLVNPAFDEHDDDQPHRTSLVAETSTIEMHRDDPEEELGVRIVGGRDTPLGNIVVQEVLKDSLIATDGRIMPGDHILEVNGMNISNVSHSQAIALLRQSSSVLYLTVLQEKGFSQRSQRAEGGLGPTQSVGKEVIQVALMKRDRSEPLGIKLVRKTEEPGVFVLDLLDGGLASKDGRLKCNDKVLSISGHDLRQGTPETAAQIIQMSDARVNFVVLRQSTPQLIDVNEEGTSSGSSSSSSNGGSPVHTRRRQSQQSCRRRSTHQKDQLPALPGLEKTITLKKEPRESLGITIGGGRDHKNRLPIYVSSVQPVGCLFRDGRIKKGDVLLGINGIDLTCLSYMDAVSALKCHAASHTVLLKVLELVPTERQGDPIEGGAESLRDPGGIWSPLWVHWLGLPSCLHWCRHISLRKSTFESWGFSIVGGYEENKGNQPFFIKTIVPATAAFFDGRLKCGDEIVEVNGVSAVGMSNAELIPMLKEQKNRVTLAVVSWPGSLV